MFVSRGRVLGALVAPSLVIGALVIGACSSDGAGGEAETLTAEAILVESAAAMTEVETAAFLLEQEGAEVAIDEAGQLLFQAADGRIARPGSADALVTVEALGFTTEVGAIAIDGQVWFTNPLTGDWTEAPAGFTFDPAVLLDPDDGLAGLMTEVAATAELRGNAQTYGAEIGPDDGRYRVVRATVSADRVATLTGGLVAESTEVDTFIDRETGRIGFLSFDLVIGGGTSSWRLEITDYDLAVDISPPEG